MRGQADLRVGLSIMINLDYLVYFLIILRSGVGLVGLAPLYALFTHYAPTTLPDPSLLFKYKKNPTPILIS